MRKKHLLYFLIVCFVFFPVRSFAALSCTVSTTCTAPSVTIFKLFGLSNSHAELFSQSNYSYSVCCSGVTGISNSCANGNAKVVAQLSGVTNAHLEENTQTNYVQDACISSGAGTFTIGYQASNCAGYDTTVASLTGVTNAHGGDASAYTEKICASHSSASSAPSVDSITTAVASGGADQSSINLISNSVKNVYVHGSASDADGCTDINTTSHWKVVLYRSSIAGGSACTPNNLNCYSVNTSGANFTLSGCTGGGDNTLNYEGLIPVQFYADGTDVGAVYASDNWVAFVSVDDNAVLNATTTDTIEVNTLASFTISSALNFGSLNPGTNTGSSNQTATATNTGNGLLDIQVYSYGTVPGDGKALSCTTGSIPSANFKYGLSAFSYASGLTVPAASTEINFNLEKSMGSTSTKDMYFGLATPTGVKGACSGVLSVVALFDSIRD